MRVDGVRNAVCCAVLVGALIIVSNFFSAVHASDAKQLLAQVNSELRQVERDMFGGKTEEAMASLESIREKLLRAKEADPNNPQVTTLEKRFEKLVKDLERRTGKDLGGGTLTAAAGSTQPELAPRPEGRPLPVAEAKPARPEARPDARPEVRPEARPDARPDARAEAPDALPHAARRPADAAESDLGRIDGAIERLKDPKWNANQLLGNMEKHLESARQHLETAREEAAKRGVTSHARFDALEAGIAEAATKISEARKMHQASQAEAAQRAGEVTADVKALKAEYDRVQPAFAKASGVAVHYNDLQPVEELIAAIEHFEKNDRDKIQRRMKAFAEKYGGAKEEIDRKADSMGYEDSYYRASFAYIKLAEGIENVQKTRTAMADDLIRRADDMKERTTKGIHDFARLGQHERIREWGRMAARFDPQNPRVKAFNDGIDVWVREDARALNDRIDKAVFPKQAADAPRDAAKLVKAAVEFLQKENEKLAAEKGGEVSKVLAVSITGPWRVFKKNILGEPIQYNLPIATAVQTESEKAQNLVRVYSSTLLTREMKGVEMGPPFIGVTMGDSYYIRPSAAR